MAMWHATGGLVMGMALAASGCCGLGGGDANSKHKLSECGVRLELPNHFGKPDHDSGCYYEWTANGDTTTLVIQSALPGDKGDQTKEKNAMPGQDVDYARKAKFGKLAGREMRTQQKVGAKIRAVWTGFVKGPDGDLNIKLTMLNEESADEFGETFWKNVRTKWLKPL